MTISRDVALYACEPFPHAPFFAILAVVGFISTLAFVAFGEKRKHHRSVSQLLLALWVLGPPLWFFYEHFYYFPAYGNMADGAGFEKLKAAQDATSKLWAAFAVVLGALYNKKFPG
jgi:hypothetical protein